jgi:Ser/Thr protein kinase RdoA (MazF antagonist)
MDAAVEHAVRAALQRVLPSVAETAAVRYRALDGGLYKRSFLVTLEDRHWVLRLPVAGLVALIDVATEAEAMSAAAAAGLAPAVVAVDAAAGVLLTDYRAGATPWTSAAARQPHNIHRAAALLRALHAVAVDLPAYDAERIAERYVAALGCDRAEPRADELLQLARDYDARYPPAVLCHNDLVAANVLDDGELTLVDFEYAARGAPILDLASLAAMNDYDESQRRELLAAYYRESDVPFTAIEFAGVVRMVRLTAHFWARLAGRQIGDAKPYARLAERMTEALQ